MPPVTLPTSAEELVAQLASIFPGFRFQPVDEPECWMAPNFHSVMREFLSYFATTAPTATERQLKNLSQLIVAASISEGDLENAIDTCFLEHLRQVDAEKYLRRFLAEARRQ
jgi:hypothetical protein